jgi:toxin secretion/phage lysis holin
MLESTSTSDELVKFKEKNIEMQKDNHLMLGYANWHEFADSLLGLKQTTVNFLAALLAVATTFITNYVWDNAGAIYFMLFLISFDAFTGILKSFKNKTFSSSRLPRILIIMISYTTLLAISWNVAKFSPFYFWLPGALYGGFIATLIVSVFENLHALKIIPDRLFEAVMKRLEALQAFILGPIKGKSKKKK